MYNRDIFLSILVLPAITLLGCGGGGGSDKVSDNTSAPLPVAMTYSHTVVLGSLTTELVGFLEAKDSSSAASIVVPATSTLLNFGSNPLNSLYRTANVAGAIVACISAPTNSTGITENINLGVNIKSVAILLDASWSEVTNLANVWRDLSAARQSFESWENCGEKPEGRPSPASVRTLSEDGGFTDDVYDGNPSTNLNILTSHITAAEADAMLSANGRLVVTQSGKRERIQLKIYRNSKNQTLIVEHGLPEVGSGTLLTGFLAGYFQR
jgi:hypothetical protein